jgi:hypothetical protein
MDPKFDHNRLLKKVVKARLTPHGIIQEGKTRTFLYDNGWWAIIVEFQSSSFSKGTYLNIGIDFNFYPRDYFAFEYGYREKGFDEVNNEVQFEHMVNEYCDFVIDKAEELKSKFKNARSAIKAYEKQSANSGWDNFNLGILFGIAGQLKTSKQLLRKVVKEKCESDWEFERQKLVHEIISWPNDHHIFIEKIKDLINRARLMKKLPVVDLTDFRESKTTNNPILAIWHQLIGKRSKA